MCVCARVCVFVHVCLRVGIVLNLQMDKSLYLTVPGDLSLWDISEKQKLIKNKMKQTVPETQWPRDKNQSKKVSFSTLLGYKKEPVILKLSGQPMRVSTSCPLASGKLAHCRARPGRASRPQLCPTADQECDLLNSGAGWSRSYLPHLVQSPKDGGGDVALGSELRSLPLFP